MKKRCVVLSIVLSHFLLITILTGCDLFKDLSLNTSEGVKFIPIEQIASETAPRGKMTFYTNEGRAVLEVFNLPFLAQSQLYEIWLYDNAINVMQTLGTFRVNPNQSAVINAKADKVDIEKADAVIITLEEFPVEEPSPSNIVALRGEITVHADTIDVKLVKPSETVLPEQQIEEEVKEEETEETQPPIIEEQTEQTKIEVSKNAIVIIAQETELIRLSTEAEDPDNDKLSYIYTSPFNDKGEWQTNYGDTGQYDVTVTVSDGTDSSSEKVLVIVNKKEEAPIIQSFIPATDSVDANEDTIVEFSVSASDVNKEELIYSWKVDNTEKALEDSFNYKLGFDDAGRHDVIVTVSDGTNSVSKSWVINIKNVNRKPILHQIEDIAVKEGETVSITPSATDPDNDPLTFKIGEPVGDDGQWVTTYDDAGTYTLPVSVSDGTDIVSQDVKVTVQNVNRPPIIKGIGKH